MCIIKDSITQRDEILNALEQIIFDILIDTAGNPYTDEKVAKIKGMSSAEVLEWAVDELDSKNCRTFMLKLGIDPAAQPVLSRAFRAARFP